MLRTVLLISVSLLVAPADVRSAEPAEPLIVAHRGLLKHAPENTLANFRACLELRLGFEFDVELTKDGQLVCIHDGTVNRTTNGSGTVSELTLEELRKLDAGSWFDPKFAGEKVPTIDEVLALVAEYRDNNVLIAVDLKASGVEEAVVRLAEKHKVLPQLLFIGKTISEPKVRKRLKAASKKVQTAAVANNADEFPAALSDANADWVYVRYLPTKEMMEAVHAAKKKSFIAGATVSGNLPANWKHCREVGLDAILTDFPLELGTELRD